MRYKISDRPFQRLAAVLVICFILISLGAGYWAVVRADQLYQDWDFPRQQVRAFLVDRGNILASDGTILVETRFGAEGDASRIYHYPRLAPITGHWTIKPQISPIWQKIGLERTFDDYLSGVRGQSGLHALDEIMHEKIVGANIVTTIDLDLQLLANELLGERAGAVIVTDPNTGGVLALSSYPTYDPNSFVQDANNLITSRANPTLNRATRGLYTPGSVFKVVTLAGALAQGHTKPTEMFSNEQGLLFVEGTGYVIRDGSDFPKNNSPYDLAHALAWSSNVTFAELGLRMGADGIRQIGKDFGFGEAPEFEIPTEASRIGSDATLFKREGLADTAYGQGELLVTPLQIALVTSAVVNEGVALEPRLVDAVRSPQGDTIVQYRPRPWKQALSRGVAEQTKEAMIISARDGFAKAGAPTGIAIGGKTGTAQLAPGIAPHAWFMAFAPAEDTQIVVVVMVENSGSGGDIAAPIARELIRAALEP